MNTKEYYAIEAAGSKASVSFEEDKRRWVMLFEDKLTHDIAIEAGRKIIYAPNFRPTDDVMIIITKRSQGFRHGSPRNVRTGMMNLLENHTIPFQHPARIAIVVPSKIVSGYIGMLIVLATKFDFKIKSFSQQTGAEAWLDEDCAQRHKLPEAPNCTY